MPRSLQLENFDTALGAFVPEVIEGAQLESERLAAYDEGYGAGWDDATKAAAAEADETMAAIRARLQDLGFTFHEARAHVMRSVQPMLEAIVTKALPQILHDSLGHRLVAELTEMIEDAGESDIDLLVAPEASASVLAALEGITSLPIEVIEDASLGAGAFHLRLGKAERELDLSALEAALSDALGALDTINKETFAHG